MWLCVRLEDDSKLRLQRRRYVLRGTLLFATVGLVIFGPMIWPSGLHSFRDVIGLLLLALLSLGAGLFFSVMTWISLKGWFGG
jgi:hypothetical protein